MLRKEFIETCCVICAGGGLITTLLEGCAGSKIITVALEGKGLSVPLKEFVVIKKDKMVIIKYLILQNDQLQYPICLYRFDDKNYAALWMRCTHQGTELQVFGDKLHCPAHGSEFNNRGGVENGPAADALKTFPVVVEGDRLKISLQ